MGPILYEEQKDIDGLQINLGKGGTIEGYVRTSLEESANEIVIALSRGDGFPVYTETNEDGAYSIGGLTPGHWQVQKSTEKIDPGLYSYSESKSEGSTQSEILWVCIVEEGRTTRYDIDLTAETECVLEGLFTIDGSLPFGLFAYLYHEGTQKSSNMVDITSDGKFTIKTNETGLHSLGISGQIREDIQMAMGDKVDLSPGKNPWFCNITTGQLTVLGSNYKDGKLFDLRYSWKGQGELRLTIHFQLDKKGRSILPSVPAGGGAVILREWDRAAHRWNEVLRQVVDIPNSGKASVELE